VETGLKIPPSKDAVEMLVAASNFGEMSSRQCLLTTADKLQQDLEQADLQAMIVYRQSVLSRLSRNISDSQRVIQEFLQQPWTQVNPRLHSLLGLLHLFQAENWAYNFDHQKVYLKAQEWGPGKNPSSMQLYVLRIKLKVLGQSYKGLGLFEDAKSAFEVCLAALQPCDSSRFLIKSNLADVYCELDYLQHKGLVIKDVIYLDEAEKIVRPEVRQLRACGRQSRPFRRLLLSLIEIEIIRCQYEAAESLIKELLAIYNTITEHDINDQVGHVRALIAWARISPESESVARWFAALHFNKSFNPAEEDVFGCGVIYLFISLAYLRNHDVDRSWAAFNRGTEIIRRKEPQFLIPGLGTYLYDFARGEIQSETGWVLPGMTQ
jgi:tetratricopeptide (TPR) repeat protein